MSQKCDMVIISKLHFKYHTIMTTFKNYTPHAIKLNDGRVFESEGIARVNAHFTRLHDNIYEQEYGDIVGLPEPEKGVTYIVSAIVLTAAKGKCRCDVVAPATGHPDCIMDEKGFIISVPGFVY